MRNPAGVQSVVVKDVKDKHQVALIRQHLRHEARAFERGDYADPMSVHDAAMTGVRTQGPSCRDHRLQSPILTPAEISAIRQSSAAQEENLKKGSADDERFYQRNYHWIRYADHNHLRVSRIIRSLALLRGKDTAKQFLARIGGES